jgi:hypothetical protein
LPESIDRRSEPTPVVAAREVTDATVDGKQGSVVAPVSSYAHEEPPLDPTAEMDATAEMGSKIGNESLE